MDKPARTRRPPSSLVALLGRSGAARRLREEFVRATRPQSRALIVAAPGMDGTELARAIHAVDPAAPLIEIDCAAGDAAAVERRLLGRAPSGGNGSLESADATAALVIARDGTCILHAVEELSHRAQARLAHALRDGEVRVRAGTHAGHGGRVPLRCRVIAITSATSDEGTEGHLRTDLRRRLGAIRLELAALRTRREDIEEIVTALMARAAVTRGVPPRRFTQAAIALVCALPWPDNISGLAVLASAVVARGSQPVRVEEVLAHFGAATQSSIVPHASLREARRQFERDYITAVLRHFDGRVAAAARVLGIQRTNLYRKARQLGINDRNQAG